MRHARRHNGLFVPPALRQQSSLRPRALLDRSNPITGPESREHSSIQRTAFDLLQLSAAATLAIDVCTTTVVTRRTRRRDRAGWQLAHRHLRAAASWLRSLRNKAILSSGVSGAALVRTLRNSCSSEQPLSSALVLKLSMTRSSRLRTRSLDMRGKTQLAKNVAIVRTSRCSDWFGSLSNRALLVNKSSAT